LTGASIKGRERSGTDEERVIVGAWRPSTKDFLKSDEATALSSLAANCGAAIERLEDPDVDMVESDDDDV
jgi:hypothetical protein